MCTYVCVLLLGVILVAGVHGLTEDQVKRTLEKVIADQNDMQGEVDGLGSDIEEDVDVEELLEQLVFQEKKRNDDDVVGGDDADDTNDVGWWFQGTTRPKSEREPAPAAWNWGSTRRGDKKRVGWSWATTGQQSKPGDKRRVGWSWPTTGQQSKPGNKKRVGSSEQNTITDLVIELPGFWWIPKGHPEKDEPAPWCQAHRSGYACCVERMMHVRGKKYHLNACLNVVFHPKSEEYSIYFSLNGYTIFHKDTELKTKTFEECFSASKIVHGGKICFRLYNICTKHRSMCVALEGKATIKDVQLELGCFTIGSGDENEDEHVPVGMVTEGQATKAEMFRALADQVDLGDADDETSSTEDDALRFEN